MLENKQKIELTSNQKNIWMSDALNNNSKINNICGIININYDFDISRVKDSILKVIKLNDAFRISVFFENEKVYQVLNEFDILEEFDIEFITDDSNIDNIKKKFFNETISINDKKLYRFKIININNEKGIILINLHHIISDAWSFANIANEFIKFYESEEVNENKIGFLEYVAEQSEYLKSDKYEKDKLFWQEYLKDLTSTVALKDDISSQSIKASRYSIKLNKILNRKINLFCKDNRVSCYALFLTALYTYIYRILDIDDITIGTPVLNRNNFKEKQIMGMFVSTLPLRMKISENMKIMELAKSISSNTFEVFRHQKYPYLDNLEYVYKNTDIKNKLYNIVLSYQNARIDIPNKDKYSTDWYFLKEISDELQIHIVDMDNTGNLRINYDFLISHFNVSEIKLFHLRIIKIIEEFIAIPDISIEDVNILSDKDKDIMRNINNTYDNIDFDITPIKMFKRQVDMRPDKVALVFKDKKYTYKQLDIISNKMANYLLSHGIKPKDRVGLLLKRNEQIVVLFLACQKIGASYVPIDERYPNSRIEYILNNSKCKYVILNSNKDINFNRINISDNSYLDSCDKEINYNSSKDDICYLIYTSGSTGLPKGVVITNKNVTNFLFGINKKLGLKSSDRIVSQTTISFDIFEMEVWLPLKNGMTIIFADDEECINPFKLRNLCLKEKANVIQLTPSKMRLFLSQCDSNDYIKNFEKIIIGGEVLDANLLKKIKNITDAHIYDVYAPSETTIWSTAKHITNNSISIGQPISNTKVWIVDKKYRILPPYIKGELVIGGYGVSSGYFEDNEKTKKAFVKLDFYDKKVYLTGDLCVINKDNDLEILNRIDNQIKINGQRVEIEEIESLILSNKDIKDVAISYRDNKYLVCFYSLKDINKNVDIDLIIRKLSDKLPSYMVPKMFIKLEDIPYTLNHKKDRKTINSIEIEDKFNARKSKIVLPKNELQKDIFDSIQKITKFEDLSIYTNIDEIGIDSLDGIKIQIDLLKKGIVLNYTELIRFKNIKGIYEHIISRGKNEIFDETYDKLNKEYNNILNNKESKKIKFTKNKNVILTGVTGFLGIHILKELIENSDIKNIYCLVRKKDEIDIKSRVVGLLNYYFDGNYIDKIDNKVILLDVDLTDKSFEKYLEKKISNVESFIHTAACVKHYGDDNYFKLINVGVTENIAKFCLKNDIKLIHASTLSISGNGFDIGINNTLLGKKDFDESSLYIGQNLNNVYAKTKFEAECVILKYIEKGLKANILRYGNLTSRRSDLKFQINIHENGFVNRIKLLTDLKLVPESQRDIYLEFTPIDEAAKATIVILKNFVPGKIYHIYNNNHVYLEDYINILNREFNFNINFVSDKKFSDSLREIMDTYDDNLKNIIVQDIDENYKVNYKTGINVKCDKTVEFLNDNKFSWKKIDDKYLVKYIKYFIKSGYIE